MKAMKRAVVKTRKSPPRKDTPTQTNALKNAAEPKRRATHPVLEDRKDVPKVVN